MSRDVTVDDVCRGELSLAQPREGYRFNIDSVILVDFVCRTLTAPVNTAADLGAGCGVVGLLLARREVASEVLLVELQPDLARLAQRNGDENGLAHRIRVLNVDLRDEQWRPRHGVDLVVSNPPFFQLVHGHLSADPQVAAAKHEVTCSLEDLLRVSAALLRPDGTLALIHSAKRQADLLVGLEGVGLAPTLIRQVQSLPGRVATRVLVHARRSAPKGCVQLEPLVVQTSPGRYSTEMRRALGEPEVEFKRQQTLK